MDYRKCVEAGYKQTASSGSRFYRLLKSSASMILFDVELDGWGIPGRGRGPQDICGIIIFRRQSQHVRRT